ncbi:molybdopterin molybdenumtransferase MoeA, partial [Streptomyces sp. SID10853]|nr:molybdopterin molybdenumtransferase MoeA [Streptomyces sp. SID10853]
MSNTPIWSVDEHLDDILAAVRPLEPIELQLPDAQGCVLVEDVMVEISLPPFDNSSMDGYAVRTVDVEGASEEFPAVLTVIGDVAAGLAELPTVGPGQAARIMTGAPLPPGAQAVVPVEWTDGGTGGGAATTMRAA